MPSISPEVLSKFTALQAIAWPTVANSLSEALEQAVACTATSTLVTPTAELYAEMAAPKVVIQFALAHNPENALVVLIDTETAAAMAAAVSDKTPSEVDDQVISEIRPALEAIVQGLCVAIGNSRNEAVAATGLSIRYQIFSFPPNFHKETEVLRVDVSILGDTPFGSLVWLVDEETARSILNLSQKDETMGSAGHGDHGSSGSDAGRAAETETGLELLMDIPLEISVELGRVKMLVKDVVDLGSGSIIEIDKAAGEPVDVLVNGRLVARGEVVVIDDNFGVRITEILSPQERLQRLQEAS